MKKIDLKRLAALTKAIEELKDLTSYLNDYFSDTLADYQEIISSTLANGKPLFSFYLDDLQTNLCGAQNCLTRAFISLTEINLETDIYEKFEFEEDKQ